MANRLFLFIVWALIFFTSSVRAETDKIYKQDYSVTGRLSAAMPTGPLSWPSMPTRMKLPASCAMSGRRSARNFSSRLYGNLLSAGARITEAVRTNKIDDFLRWRMGQMQSALKIMLLVAGRSFIIRLIWFARADDTRFDNNYDKA